MMKANISLELTKEDLEYEVQNLISEIAKNEIKNIVRSKADQMIEEELKDKISPIVEAYLENAKIKYDSRDRNIDTYISGIIKDYLDEKVYVYSKSSDKLSEVYKKSSDNSGKSTRASMWVTKKAIESVDTYFYEEIQNLVEEKVKQIAPTKEEIEEIIKREIKERFS